MEIFKQIVFELFYKLIFNLFVTLLTDEGFLLLSLLFGMQEIILSYYIYFILNL